MIRSVVSGNLLESGAQTLVNTVNCVGVMGKGIALEFKRAFPAMYADYVARCNRREVRLGEPYLYAEQEPWVLNFPTKQHWRDRSRLADVERGLDYLIEQAAGWGVTSLAVPPLGCGLGGLDWSMVGPIIYGYLHEWPIPVDLYAPYGTPQDQLTIAFLAHGPRPAGTIPVSHVALVEIIARLGDSAPRQAVGQTRAMQLSHIATERGLATGFEFAPGTHGPFSKEVKAAFDRLVNNGLVVIEQHERLREILPGPAFAEARQTHAGELLALEPIIDAVVEQVIRGAPLPVE